MEKERAGDLASRLLLESLRQQQRALGNFHGACAIMRTHRIPALLWRRHHAALGIGVPRAPMTVPKWCKAALLILHEKGWAWTREDVWVLFAASIFLESFWNEFSDGRQESIKPDQRSPSASSFQVHRFI